MPKTKSAPKQTKTNAANAVNTSAANTNAPSTAAANPRVLELEAQVRQLEEDKARLELQLDEALAEEGEMVAIPLVACEGYARRAVNMRLSRDQAEQLNQMRAGLNAIDARTEDGKHVDTTSDTVRYLIEVCYKLGHEIE